MLDDMYQEETDKVLDDRVARPVSAPVERPSFGSSVWNTVKAPFKGAAAGAVEVGATNSDILNAFGKVQAGYGLQADPTLLFNSDEQKRRMEAGQASRDEIQSGEAFTSETGNALRATAKDIMPDPATSNVVENILAGFTRFGVKAVGYTAFGGPIPGAVMTGVDEGMTEADKLKEQGVDFTTRMKGGLVSGISATAQVALPISGKTIPQTVGLVAVGGPGGYVAQQAASRAILQNAGYDKIAEQYDPFDPVGLAVSTLVPAGFGAYAMRAKGKASAPVEKVDPALSRELTSMGMDERRALKYNDPRLDSYAAMAAEREGVPAELMLAIKNAGEKSNSNQVSPKKARGVAQFIPENLRKYGVVDPTDPVQSIDGMSKYLRDTMKQYDGNIQAVIADYNGGPRQANLVLQGKAPAASETVKYLKRVNDYMAEHQGAVVGKRVASDPEAVEAARVQMMRDVIDSMNLKDPADIIGAQEHLNAVMRSIDQLGAGERVSVGDSINLDKLERARMLDDMAARLEKTRADLLPGAGNMADPGTVSTLRDQVRQLEQKRPAMTDDEFRARAKEIQADQGISYKQALSEAKKEIGSRADDIDSQIERINQQLEMHRNAVEADAQVRGLDAQIENVRAERSAIDTPTPTKIALEVKKTITEMPYNVNGTDSQSAPDVQGGISRAAEAASKAQEGTPIKSEQTAKPAPVESESTGSSVPGTQERGAPASNLEARISEISRLSPDLMVQIEGMDKPMRVSDVIDAVKAEAAKESNDAGLLQVAAECFLRTA